MKLFAKLSLALLMSFSLSQVSLAEDWEDAELEDGEELFEDGSDRRGCKRVKCLVVCGNASVGGTLSVSGNETVTGSVTAGSFALSPAAAVGTAAVPGVGGLLAWGEVGNIGGTAPTAGTNFTWTYASSTANAAAMSGMTPTLTPAGTAGLTLTNAGIYIFQYQATNNTAQATVTSIQLLANTAAIPNSLVSLVPGTATSVEVNGFIICYQPAGALIQLQLVTAAAYTFPAAGIGAKLSAMRIA